MQPSAFMGARLIGLEGRYAYLVQAPFALVAAGTTWYAFRLHGTVPMAFAVLLFSTVIATPYIHSYDLTLVGPAVLLLLCHGRNDGFRLGETHVWLAVWLLPITVMALNWIRLPVGCLILTAALGLIVARLRSPRFSPSGNGGPSLPVTPSKGESKKPSSASSEGGKPCR